ncbi:malectin [Eupeodes corollae]|uniref:malectin n=1 Tax=Eupeodes corollae TaxID=290404 RepID=UPI00248FCDBE|nr:malectin [Eupeodes corollae]
MKVNIMLAWNLKSCSSLTRSAQNAILALILLVQLTRAAESTNRLRVVYAVNAGGDSHTDKNGILFEQDPLRGKVGTESDYGRQLLIIGRVSQQDEILYQTERYHTATFGYDLPVTEDGEYVLILKFCEVYFNAPNMKVFDVVLNGDHTVISDLDIFHQVGKGTAHDEYVFFTVSRKRLFVKEEESEIRNGRIRLEFVKGIKDNPKINAFALLKGDVESIPRLPPIAMEERATPLETEIPIEDIVEKPSLKSRKTSGPKQPNPYTMDDSSVMLPVFIAIGAFIPLLFCLCKL